jgi:hypothetical protein
LRTSGEHNQGEKPGHDHKTHAVAFSISAKKKFFELVKDSEFGELRCNKSKSSRCGQRGTLPSPLPSTTLKTPPGLVDQEVQTPMKKRCPPTLAPLRRYLDLRLPEHAATFDNDFDRFFSRTCVQVSEQNAAEIAANIRDLEIILNHPRWIEATLDGQDAAAQIDQGCLGVFQGYDFHLSAQGPRLIEINTNAGGGWLNLGLDPRIREAAAASDQEFEDTARNCDAPLVAMFEAEWQHARGFSTSRPAIAIVDDDPERQFLFPEFQLAAAILRAHGYQAYISDPRELERVNGAVFYRGNKIDLIYNRLTDFFLRAPNHADLLMALLADEVVITPSPRVYASCADKRNLAWLSQPSTLLALDLAPELVSRVTQWVPETEIVSLARADEFWSRRRDLFFKPRWGFGSRAAYRGAKLTRATFQAIVNDDYVAQRFVAPSETQLGCGETNETLKVDFRNYTYGGRTLVRAARAYQGQTTNFRTPGGGFAPIVTSHASDADLESLANSASF